MHMHISVSTFKVECAYNSKSFVKFPVLRGETMVQGIMAGWIFIMIVAALYSDENLRKVIPAVFGAFLAFVAVAIPIWLPLVLSYYHKRVKTEKQVVEIEVVE